MQVELQSNLDDDPIESILKSEREPLYGLYQETKDERNELFNRAMEYAYKNPIDKYLTGWITVPPKHYSRVSLEDLAAELTDRATETGNDSEVQTLLGDTNHEKNFKVHFQLR